MDVIQLKTDATTSTISLSQPPRDTDLKISVTSTTVQFSDINTKEGV
jgi:hypothetical protein